MQTTEVKVLRAERDIATLGEKIVATEQALPVNLKDEGEA